MIKFLNLVFISSFLLIACEGDKPTTQKLPIETKEDSTVINKKSIIKDTASIVDTIAIDTTPKPQKVERPSRKPPKMKFEHITFEYDTIRQGDVIKHDFKFTNIGERPLEITNVYGSCGCTIASRPFLDIAPNESNVIKSKFDSKGKKGNQETTITVECNGTPKTYQLTLKGYVKEESIN